MTRRSLSWPEPLRRLPEPLVRALTAACDGSASLYEEHIVAAWFAEPSLFGAGAGELLEQVVPRADHAAAAERLRVASAALRDALGSGMQAASPRLLEIAGSTAFEPEQPVSLLHALGRRRGSLVRRLGRSVRVHNLWPALSGPQAPALQVASGPAAGETLQLWDGCTVRIGRSSEPGGPQALYLSDRTISRVVDGSAPLILHWKDGHLRLELSRGILGWRLDLWDPRPPAAADWPAPRELTGPAEFGGALAAASFEFRLGSTLFVVSIPSSHDGQVSVEETLQRLLRDLFSVDQLQHLLACWPPAAELTDELPGRTIDKATFVMALVGALRSQGLLTGFLRCVAEKRPRAKAAIEKVAAQLQLRGD